MIKALWFSFFLISFIKLFVLSKYTNKIVDVISLFTNNNIFKISNKYLHISISKISGFIIENKIFSLFNIALFKNEKISSFVVS